MCILNIIFAAEHLYHYSYQQCFQIGELHFFKLIDNVYISFVQFREINTSFLRAGFSFTKYSTQKHNNNIHPTFMICIIYIIYIQCWAS